MARPVRAFLAFLAIWLVACTGTAPPTGSAPAAPSASPKEPWEQDWDRLVEAAKREGRVAVAGIQGEDNRVALTEAFEKKYGITVDYVGVGGPELPPRVSNERSAGIYEWDVFIAGTTTLIRGLKPIGALQPLEPAFMLPEVSDKAKWRGGTLPYMDSDQHVISLLRRAGQYFYVNTNMVKPEEFKSWRDLLDPKWKGKIVVGRDPMVAGYGRAMFLFFYLHPQMGQDFIREFARQDIQMLRDDRTAAQWLAQGRMPLCFCSNVEIDKLREDGLPVSVVEPKFMREGSHTTSGPANIALADHPAHPNAAKLYLNWVLSKDGGALISKSMGDPSTRVDVPTDQTNAWVVPDPAWRVTNDEDALTYEEPLLTFLAEVFGR